MRTTVHTIDDDVGSVAQFIVQPLADYPTCHI